MRNFSALPALQDATIAIQKEGRLTRQSLDWVNQTAGANFPVVGEPFADNRRREITDPATNITLLGLSNGDMLDALVDDVATYAISSNIQYDNYGDSGCDNDPARYLTPLAPLGFAACRLVFARLIDRQQESKKKGIVTSYYGPTMEYLARCDTTYGDSSCQVDVKCYKGGVEAIARRLGYACVDLVESGRSLRDNGFEEIETIGISQALLVGNPSGTTRWRNQERLQDEKV